MTDPNLAEKAVRTDNPTTATEPAEAVTRARELLKKRFEYDPVEAGVE